MTVGSGTYTAQDVTAAQVTTTSYVDLSGSLIAYTPPSGTQAVIYQFNYGYSYQDGNHMSHIKFFIDSDEVTNARRMTAESVYLTNMPTFRWIITIGDGNETATGKLASWGSAKTLKLSIRAYNTSLEQTLHRTQYWDGTTGLHLMVPTLTLTAIG